jgi:hypothetical protein
VQEALQKQGPTNYVGIHPHYDFGLIPNEKNLALVCIGYANIDGFPANVIGNEKVNDIRRYARKHNLDAFFGIEANINWKKMLEEGQLHQGREFIANGALENGAFCTVFSENFHKF